MKSKIKTKYITTEDPQWNSFLRQCPHDFYHLPEYTKLAAKHEGGEGGAFLVHDTVNALLLPLILRPIPEDLGAPAAWSDAFSPYGYSCPLLINSTGADVLPNLISALLEAARYQQIVSIFVRLHPLLGIPAKEWAHMGEIVDHGNIIYIDLSPGYDFIFSEMRKNHRIDITKLRKLGYRIEINAWQYFDDFVNIYRQSMQRKAAGNYYFFSKDYFEELRIGNIRHNVKFVSILAPDQTLACGGIVGAGGDIVTYHLGATSADHLKHAPSKLFFDEIIQWACQNGYQYALLGGGLGASNDSLYHFKTGFSKLTAPFHSLRTIVDKEKYNALIGRWQKLQAPLTEDNSTYFPPYYIR